MEPTNNDGQFHHHQNHAMHHHPNPMMPPIQQVDHGVIPEQQPMITRVPPPSKSSASSSAAAPKFKKAPDAPKRFKSAFIIYSAEKHKEIKEEFAKQGRSEKTTDIAKLVSEAWRELPPDEKEKWEAKARKDKARYEVEKAMYKGPWKVPANKRTPKDPTAPKRPMSAFLAFSNKRRAGLKRQHPDATNADLSKMLSKQWREAPEDLRSRYTSEEKELRQAYKVEMAAWRKKVAEEKKAERKEREAMAMQTAENRANEAARNANAGNPSMEGVQEMPMGFYGYPPQGGDMGYGMQGGQGQGFPPFPPMQQQQLLQQLLTQQQPMNPMMPNSGTGGGNMVFGQPNGGQFQQSNSQFGNMGHSAGGNFGLEFAPKDEFVEEDSRAGNEDIPKEESIGENFSGPPAQESHSFPQEEDKSVEDEEQESAKMLFLP